MTPGLLFEVSWEVAHKVGGVHTVVSSKARTLAERYGDAFVLVGPWLLSEGNAERVLEPDPSLDAFADGCRGAGVPVRAGRWLVPGRPRTLLVEFTGLYARKDDILKELWDRHRVDSLQGGWDYVEPVLFGAAAGIVIEKWWREVAAGAAGAAAQFHEWLGGAGLLHLRRHAPGIATVFTCHATVLGRALGTPGRTPADRLGGRPPDRAAADLGVQARHSLEGALAREADAFTAVSDLVAEEAEAYHGIRPAVVLPNGLDIDVLARRVGGLSRRDAAGALRNLAARFLGEDVGDAAVLAAAGRCEFRNKGWDLLLDAAGALNRRPGPRAVLFLFVPTGTSGVRHDLAERMKAPALPSGPLAGVATHNVFDADRDPIARRCTEAGLTNAAGSRVKVIRLPAYLEGGDGVLGLTYEAAVQAADLTVFPSLYDAWGYTPQESLALGVPTVTTDASGFGRWAAARGLGPAQGVHVLARRDRTDEQARDDLAALLDAFLAGPRDRKRSVAACRRAVRGAVWPELVKHHEEAFALALGRARDRVRDLPGARDRAAQRLAARPQSLASRPRIVPLDVRAELPAELAGLEVLARNWWWSSDPEARDLFREVSPETWEARRGNPVRLLREAPAADLEARARDRDFLARLDRTVGRLRAYLGAPARPRGAVTPESPVAYFCAEYGLHECLPVYGGGLGILAGDHLRSASDLGLPLVAIGLLYRRGYFRQRLEGGVEQQVVEDEVDPRLLPLDLVEDAEGRPVLVALPIPGGTLTLRAWRARVGRVPLFLLDTDLAANRPEDRTVTHVLYGGDPEARLRQEIVLGRGGVRLLERLGIRPSVFHLNEGHGAFVPLERVGQLVRDDCLTFSEAREVVRAGTAFTTHTPVPAGHDRFGEDLMRRYFSDASSWIGLPWEKFFLLGSTPSEPGLFNMTGLAIHFSSAVNGVSREHGRVSRRILLGLRPHLLAHEVPVDAVTNGVHLGAWTAGEMARLLGAEGRAVEPADFAGRAPGLDPAALWEVRSRLRRRLLDAVRARLLRASGEGADDPGLLERSLAGLDEAALLVGFARRFALYKRADLLLRDPDRLLRILDGAGRPVRILVAGKAHPRDAAASQLLARVARLSRSAAFAGRLFVLEDYDLGLARLLVQGADVWLNTPRPPLEASGTSGMKAAANGVLHLSVGDGWWLEGFDGTNGWRIGGADSGAADAARDAADAADLYRLLEEEVAPLFFRRGPDGLPRAWLERVRRCLATLPPVFHTARMVEEYASRAYEPLARRAAELRADGFAAARARAAAWVRMRRGMAEMRILSAAVAGADAARPGDALAVQVEVDPGPLSPEDLRVELVAGRREADGGLREVEVLPLAAAPAGEGPARRFEGTWRVRGTGSFGWGIRVRPRPETEGAPPSLHDPVVWA